MNITEKPEHDKTMKTQTNYNLSEITRYAVNCEACKAGTGNHTQAETANKAAKQRGFIAIVTAEDGTINLCPLCVPPEVAKFFVTAHDPGLKDPGSIDDDAKSGDAQGSLIDKGD